MEKQKINTQKEESTILKRIWTCHDPWHEVNNSSRVYSMITLVSSWLFIAAVTRPRNMISISITDFSSKVFLSRPKLNWSISDSYDLFKPLLL